MQEHTKVKVSIDRLLCVVKSIEIQFSTLLYYPLGKNLYMELLEMKLMMYFSLAERAV